MVNYNKGKIYKIECLTTGLIYVGSTTKDYLSQRLTKHICAYRQYLRGTYRFTTSFKIIENNNYRIELLEEVNCETKDQLLIREGHYIRLLDCVNRCVAGRTDKQYWIDKKDDIKRKQSARFNCPCGSDIRQNDKSQHNKTKKHQAYLETLKN